MSQENLEDIKQFISEQYARFSSALSVYQWSWEKARFHELVFCLMVKLIDSNEAVAIARETMEMFASLDLLGVEDLADCIEDKEEPDYHESQPALMFGILQRQGVDEKRARAVVTTICQAAGTLQREFGGKVQKYLRKCGDEILADVPRHFSFSYLSDGTTRLAFTHWLQNVLNMPLPFSHPSVKELCERFSVSPDELVEIADENDINVALLDEWASDYMARCRQEVHHE